MPKKKENSGKKTNPKLEPFIENVDAWMKSITTRVNNLEKDSLKLIVSENTTNIQHNYELIYELKNQIDELKQEINALKLIQILSLKK